jgi:hypothetical protein
MQFLRRHFEKIVLSAVLAGLGAVAFWLSVAVKEVKEVKPITFGPPPGTKPLTNVDLAPLRAALANMTEAPALELSGEHNVFNPVTWKRRPNGDLVKMTRQGATALTVTEIRPLYFTVSVNRGSPLGFAMVARHALGHEMNWYAVVGRAADASHPYPVVTATNTGSADKPTWLLQVRIPEDGVVVPVSEGKPYKKVETYEADFKYSASDSTNVFNKGHVGDSLPLSGESFRILAITSNAVTMQDARTAQKTEIQWNGGPKP